MKQRSVDSLRNESPPKATLFQIVQSVLSPDLIVQERPFIYLETPQNFWGLCRYASEAIYLLEGKPKNLKPKYSPEHMHWWLERHPEGEILDPIRQFFEEEYLNEIYDAGEEWEYGKQPSETALEIIRRVSRWL